MYEIRDRMSAERDRTPTRFNTQLFVHQYKDSRSKSKNKDSVSPSSHPREPLKLRESEILTKMAVASREVKESDLFDHRKNLNRLRSILKESRKKESKI